MTMITPSYLGETIEYSSLHACRSTLEDPTDDGPGIPESEREVIFRRFWRRDRRRPGSAGLGLSIVSRIVEAHAGSISVENRAEGGAAFSLRFARAA